MKSPKQRKPSDSKNPDKNRIASVDTSAAYGVTLSTAAETAYERFYRRAAEAHKRGDIANAHYTALKTIDEVIENMIPRNPFDRRYALRGNLSGVFRIKKGRLRICWTGNSSKREVCILFISETLRKDGDANDPYEVFTKLLLKGDYDAVFTSLGLPPPSKHSGKSTP